MNDMVIGGIVVGGAVVIGMGVGIAIGDSHGKSKAKTELLELANSRGGYITNIDIYNTIPERNRKKLNLGPVPQIISKEEMDQEIQKTIEALEMANNHIEELYEEKES